MESEFHYVLDLLQESIAIVDGSMLEDSKGGKAFEYVNNCFLAHFQPIIEHCAHTANESSEGSPQRVNERTNEPIIMEEDHQKNNVEQNAECTPLLKFINAKIFVEFDKDADNE